MCIMYNFFRQSHHLNWRLKRQKPKQTQNRNRNRNRNSSRREISDDPTVVACSVSLLRRTTPGRGRSLSGRAKDVWPTRAKLSTSTAPPISKFGKKTQRWDSLKNTNVLWCHLYLMVRQTMLSYEGTLLSNRHKNIFFTTLLYRQILKGKLTLNVSKKYEMNELKDTLNQFK